MNYEIDQLQDGIPQPTDVSIYKDLTANLTKRFNMSLFTQSASINNIEWVTDNAPGYALNEIVTYGGKIWQSKIVDNLNITPGSDDDAWELLTKAINWGRWAAGVFLELDVFVVRTIDGEDHIVQLVDAARPYNTTDFDAEYEAGDWKSLTQNIIVKAATLALGTVELDLNMLKERVFNVGMITEPKLWSLLKADNLIKLTAIFEIDDTHTQTFPATWEVSTIAGIWNDATKEWEPLDIGKYEIELTSIGGVHHVKLIQL